MSTTTKPPAAKIATISKLLDPEHPVQARNSFDSEVNAALENGWKVLVAGFNDQHFWAIMIKLPEGVKIQ
jgi:hypothetical protein